MAYDEILARRILDHLGARPGLSTRKMFGGIAFLKNGHMFAGVANQALMARVGPAQYEAALAEQHVRLMDFTGRPLRGYVYVDGPGLASEPALQSWLARCEAFVDTLPPKSASRKRR